MKGARPFSPATMLALLALFVAIGGTAYSIGRNDVKARNIAPDAVTNKHTRFFEHTRTKRVEVTARDDTNQAQNEAPAVRLGGRGPFRVYGKCFGEIAGDLQAVVYIRITRGSALLASSRDNLPGAVIGAGEEDDVLHPGLADFNREILFVNGDVDSADVDRGTFYATTPIRAVIGVVGAAAIGPSPGNGDPPAPWSKRSRCMFSASLTGG